MSLFKREHVLLIHVLWYVSLCMFQDSFIYDAHGTFWLCMTPLWNNSFICLIHMCCVCPLQCARYPPFLVRNINHWCKKALIHKPLFVICVAKYVFPFLWFRSISQARGTFCFWKTFLSNDSFKWPPSYVLHFSSYIFFHCNVHGNIISLFPVTWSIDVHNELLTCILMYRVAEIHRMP